MKWNMFSNRTWTRSDNRHVYWIKEEIDNDVAKYVVTRWDWEGGGTRGPTDTQVYDTLEEAKTYNKASLKKAFIVCSVRGANEEYRRTLELYAEALEEVGFEVHLPHRDTDQDVSSLDICTQNRKAIEEADEVHVFYSSDSQGTHFDLGVAFSLRKKIVIANNEQYDETKSFARMIAEWAGTVEDHEV